ncbi:hypothetical protein [Hyphomicrobium sp. CS1GBMeth3]|uniref:hypothetical protein n=1 Tax=Hyphomicrobium sp. CS1GBMeth3 TaxID=1892845 RepID=UPI001114F027|nr:hypothetical protein [Hyphomicrobium sp. CS1GBMeth3]
MNYIQHSLAASLSTAATKLHEWTTNDALPNWIRMSVAHMAEILDLCAGTITLAELREMYREYREDERIKRRKAAELGLRPQVRARPRRRAYFGIGYAQASAAI